MLTQLENYLNENYTFRCEKRYKGIIDRLNAWADSGRAEEHENLISREHYWKPQFYASDPYAYEQYYKEYLDKHERDNFSVNLMRLIKNKNREYFSLGR